MWFPILLASAICLVVVNGYVIRGSGSFRLNGIFPITNNDRINFQSGVMMAEAMRYAVERINSQPDFLYGYKLAIEKIFDLRKESKLTKSVLSTFMGDVPFLIGPYSSESSYITSILTGTFRQVVISYGATYIDFDKYGPLHGYMLRTVPSDTFRVQAISDFLVELGWNYVALINSYGYNGERDARYLIQSFEKIKVCLAEQVDLPRYPEETNYVNTIKNLNKDKRLKALILFTTNEDSRNILQAIKKLKLKNRFYLLCVFGCSNYIEVVEGLEDVASGTISLDLNYKEVSDFKEYFLKQNPTNNQMKYFRNFWQKLFNCTLYSDFFTYPKMCSGTEQLSENMGYYPLTPVYTVIDAVYSAANAIRSLIEHYCHIDRIIDKNSSHCLVDAFDRKIYSHTAFVMLVNMSYIDGTLNNLKSWLRGADDYVKYDFYNFNYINGRVLRDLIGTWEIQRIGLDDYPNVVLTRRKPMMFLREESLIYRNGTFIKPNAVCSDPCPAAFIRLVDTNPLKGICCWQCSKCPDDSISRNNTCHKCKHTEMRSSDKTRCEALPRKFIDIDSPFVIMLFILSCIGVCCVAIVTIVFVRFNETRIVRSSGRDLCYVILLGIAITFSCPFVYLAPPSIVVCVLRGVLPGVGFLTCYAPLFLKTNRIYRIFLNAKKSVTRPALISPQSQILVLCGIVSVQILLCCVWFVSKQPAPSFFTSTNGHYVTVHCKQGESPITMVLNLTLPVMFMIWCTLFAFKTRHFPKNYNEAKYIGITLYITCVAWAVFLPTYFLTNDKYEFMQEYLTCVICIIVGYITLAGLFGQKIKMLMSENKEKNKEPQMLTIKGPGPPSTCDNLLKEKPKCKNARKFESPANSSASDRSSDCTVLH